MKKLQLLLILLIPFLGYTQINTFPWTHDFENGVGLSNLTNDDGEMVQGQNMTIQREVEIIGM